MFQGPNCRNEHPIELDFIPLGPEIPECGRVNGS